MKDTWKTLREVVVPAVSTRWIITMRMMMEKPLPLFFLLCHQGEERERGAMKM